MKLESGWNILTKAYDKTAKIKVKDNGTVLISYSCCNKMPLLGDFSNRELFSHSSGNSQLAWAEMKVWLDPTSVGSKVK
jgi:hypothetical protein